MWSPIATIQGDELPQVFWGHLQDECNQNVRDEPDPGKTLRVSPVTLGIRMWAQVTLIKTITAINIQPKQWTSKWQKLCVCSKLCS